MAEVRVQVEAFDAGAEIARLLAGRNDAGGLGCFIGTVRGAEDGTGVRALTLEHYPGMTERAMAAIAQEAERRWALLGCVLVHRVGRLLPGEGIVLVLALSAHRAAALEATTFLIDWLKTRAPFWKQEKHADGTVSWVQHRAEDEAAAARWAERQAS
ncbi:MAG: molybdenum cofactor biosynthesis protein MoaE [Acetobacteraceae bacterium]|nr:molybdenum cofactor biosynthesis protein MoaE [Acetobacteraceae bacterium]